MKNINNLFDKLLEILPGGVYGLLSVGIGTFCDLIAIFLFPGGYNFFVNMISELGIGPQGIFFNIGVILAGIFAIPFDIYLGRSLFGENVNEKLRKTAVNISVICCICLSLIGVFPANQENLVVLTLHGIFASICFIGGLCYLILFSILMLKDEKFSKFQAYFGFIVAALFLVFLFTWLPAFEWIANVGIVLWTYYFCIYMIYKRI